MSLLTYPNTSKHAVIQAVRSPDKLVLANQNNKEVGGQILNQSLKHSRPPHWNSKQ